MSVRILRRCGNETKQETRPRFLASLELQLGIWSLSLEAGANELLYSTERTGRLLNW